MKNKKFDNPCPGPFKTKSDYARLYKYCVVNGQKNAERTARLGSEIHCKEMIELSSKSLNPLKNSRFQIAYHNSYIETLNNKIKKNKK